MALELNNKKTINAWTMYDWANSVYPLVIIPESKKRESL